MSSYAYRRAGVLYSPKPDVVKSQGYDYGYTDTYVEPKSELDCPYNKPVFVAAQTTPNDIGGVSVFPAYCKSPEKPSDCKEGTIFQDGGYSKGGATYDEYGRRTSGYALPVKLENKCVKQVNPIKGNPKDCEVEWIKELKRREKVGPYIKLSKPLETKDEFMARCQGTTPVDPIKPIVEAIKPKTEEEEYRNFIFLVMAGIGAYLILSE